MGWLVGWLVGVVGLVGNKVVALSKSMPLLKKAISNILVYIYVY